MGIGVEVAFAELDEAAKGLQAVHGPDHGFSGQGIEDDVDPFAICMRHHLIGKGERPRIEHHIGAKVAQQRTLFLAARRGDDARPAIPGDLQRGQSDCTGAAMDENRLAALEAAQMHERIVCREECNGQGGGCLKCELLRQAAYRKGRCDHMAGEAAGDEGDDAISESDPFDVRT